MGLTDKEIQALRASRLSKLLETYNLTQADFCKMTEGRIYSSNLNSWIKGKKTITEASIETILEFFPEVNENWLLGRSDYMMKERAEQIERDSRYTSRRMLCSLEVLDASIDLICSQLGMDRIEPTDRQEIEELRDKLLSYSDFLIYEYIKKRQP